MKQKILFVTGDRSEYDLLKPVAKALLATGVFEVGFFVCGTHQLYKFGNTIDLIYRDGFNIISKINNVLHSDAPSARAKTLSIELSSLVDTVDNFAPEMLVVLGDREEALAAATVCAYSGILCVHLCGGDATADGNSDNLIRDAVSKMAHIHFPSTERSRTRLLELGEDEWRVFNYGATGIDSLASVNKINRRSLFKRLNVSDTDEKYIVLVQHPILSDLENSLKDLEASLSAIVDLNILTFIGRPNSDPGNFAFHEMIDDFCGKNKNLLFYRNLERESFVNLLRHSSVIVGNSSAGIIEAPFLKLPAINVGLRQRGREAGGNVIYVNGIFDDIRAALTKAVYDLDFRAKVRSCPNPYGDGKAGERIAEKLVEISKLHEKFRIKKQIIEK